MRRALDLAQGHRTHPNPRVGAVVVSPSGEVVGEGAHVAAGQPHAEAVAIGEAGAKASGATLYVTLEPCNHHGRTPPCTEAIIDAGIARVVLAMRDPDPKVSGEGIARLADSGIEVVESVMEPEAESLNEAYVHHRRTGMPLVTMKWAMTLDGAVAAQDGSSRWISSEEARADAHQLRAETDAVVIGAGTLRADDPELTVRTEGYRGSQPVPIVIAGNEELPVGASIWQRDPIVIATSPRTAPSGEVVVVDGDGGLPDPVATCRAIAALGHLDVLLEGGPKLAASWWSHGVISRGVAYIAAKIAGGSGLAPLSGVFSSIGDAEIVEITSVRRLGSDYRIDFSRK